MERNFGIPITALRSRFWSTGGAVRLRRLRRAVRLRWLRRPLVLVGLRATGDCRLADWSASSDAPSLLLARGDYDADGARAPWAWCDGGQTVSPALDKHLTKMVED